jgi:hypothetical protein
MYFRTNFLLWGWVDWRRGIEFWEVWGIFYVGEGVGGFFRVLGWALGVIKFLNSEGQKGRKTGVLG